MDKPSLVELLAKTEVGLPFRRWWLEDGGGVEEGCGFEIDDADDFDTFKLRLNPGPNPFPDRVTRPRRCIHM